MSVGLLLWSAQFPFIQFSSILFLGVPKHSYNFLTSQVYLNLKYCSYMTSRRRKFVIGGCYVVGVLVVVALTLVQSLTTHNFTYIARHYIYPINGVIIFTTCSLTYSFIYWRRRKCRDNDKRLSRLSSAQQPTTVGKPRGTQSDEDKPLMSRISIILKEIRFSCLTYLLGIIRIGLFSTT